MARALRRARGVGEGATVFSTSWRSSWRRWRGWTVPNAVGSVRCSARPWRGAVSSPVTAGHSRGQDVVWRVRGAVARRWAREGVRGRSGASRRRVPVARSGMCASTWPCRSWRARVSRARVCPALVVLLSGNGGYQLVQGTKGERGDMLARVGGERREGEHVHGGHGRHGHG
jgi:hypothetical protein